MNEGWHLVMLCQTGFPSRLFVAGDGQVIGFSLAAGLSPGARVVWLDQVLPMYRKNEWAIEAVIGMVKSTNHRFRVTTIFRRLTPAL